MEEGYEQEKRTRVKKDCDKRKFVRYDEGAERYSISETKFRRMARDAKAVYKLDRTALVNTEIFERYLELFRLVE